jgi:DNA end-binding protein Ku
MYFADEIREVAEYGQRDGEVNKQELKLAKELIDNLSGHFQPEQYHDKYQEELKALVEAKLKGKQAPVTAERKPAPVINMMEALKKSLAEQEQARRSAKETRQRPRKKAS